MANVFIEEQYIEDIGDAIRNRTGKEDLIYPENMAEEILSIGADANAIASDIRKNKTAYINGELVTGKLAEAVGITKSDSAVSWNKGIGGGAIHSISLSNTIDQEIILSDGASITLQTHSSNFGNATTEDVISGKTFTSTAGLKVTGMKNLTGTYVWQKCNIGYNWEYETSELLGTEKPSDATGASKKSFTITDDGRFELSSEDSVLGGYYAISGGDGKSIYKAEWKYASSGSYYNYYKLTIIENNALAKQGSPVDVVTSDVITDYPENDVQNGYWYVFIDAESKNEFVAQSLSDIHVWEKYTLDGYSLEEKLYSNITFSYKSVTGTDIAWDDISYADEINYSSGTISLVNPTTISAVSTVEQANPILGKYAYNNYYQKFYRVPSDATITFNTVTTSQGVTTGQNIMVSPAYELSISNPGEFVELIVTNISDSYPTDGEQNGYRYVYKGAVATVS